MPNTVKTHAAVTYETGTGIVASSNVPGGKAGDNPGLC